MNPSFPGSSGDRHNAPPPPTSSINPLPKPPTTNPQQAPPPHTFAPLSHQTLHPIHGGSSNPSTSATTASNASSNTPHGALLHGGSLPPPPLTATLPPPPTATGSSAARSPHHHHHPHHHPQLPGSILHPPPARSNALPTASSVLGKPTGAAPQSQQQPPPTGSNVLMSHPVRMGTQPPSSSSGAPAPGKPAPTFSVRAPINTSPRRQDASLTSQNAAYGANRSNETDGDANTSNAGSGGGDHYGRVSMAAPPRHRELRVEDALLYLDQVKQQFGNQPDIYNQFLDVMKDFKAQAIDTPGVILRVSNLFRGYPNLILGFNTFLPPGYRIRPDTTIEVIPQQMTGAGARGPVTQPSMFGGNVSNMSSHVVNKQPPATSRQPLGPSSQPSSSSQSKGMHPGGPIKAAPSKKQPQGGVSSGSNQGSASSGSARASTTNPVEFDHAIHYVTTIKQRFADEPETYKEFLAILHTYQREQRSIRQVLDQVSYLFRDHPDLLREFTFFLPDAVQEQAKERLNRAAEKAQQRKDQMAQKAAKGNYGRDNYGASGYSSSQGSGRRLDNRSDSPSSAAMKGRSMLDDHHMMMGDKMMKSSDRMKGDSLYKHPLPLEDDLRRSKGMDRRDKERERERNNKALFAHKRSKRRTYDSKERRDFLAMSDVVIDKEEWGIFEKIKKILPSRDNWREFLKCLELYSQEVLGRAEMMSLIKNLFGRHTDLVEEFDQLLSSHGEQKSPQEIWPFIPLAETDLSQCRRATPSYRALPASYPIPPCSYRSKLEKSVCNDSWVSVPTGSEDFSFKNMRKNQYEEALFKCEDERFEIDMVIDANASTISVLEPLAREIEVLKEKDGEDKLWNYVVDKGTFRVTHLNAITRIYGEAGGQILDLLRKYPAGAIPVILKRLKQKDDEWRRARQDLNKQWKEVNEKNYHKSLDHSSFYFKQKDKKQTSMKVLLQEAKKKLETDEKQSTDDGKNETIISTRKSAPEASDIAKALTKEQEQQQQQQDQQAGPKTEITMTFKPHFVYKFAAAQIHKDAFGLLSYAAEKNLGTTDKEKVSKIWQTFFFPFFNLQEEWLVRKPKRTTVTLEKSKRLRMGTEVSTEFGEGTIQYYNQDKGYHVVNLPIGQAYLQPEAITIEEASDFPSTLNEMDDESQAEATLSKTKSILFGSQHAYGFLRLYQMLHHRLERARELCEKAKRNRYRRMINPAARALAHARHTMNDATGKEKTGDYQAFLSKLYALIDGSVDSTKYEDCCRSLMGSTSYFLFTMDKLVSLILKQMQHLATDETCQELLKAFGKQTEASEEIDVALYLNKTKAIFEGEGAFRLEFKPGVLRRTPLEPRAATPAAADAANFKVWAPSPRVRQQEPSRWLIEPTLAIEYLGSMEEEGEDEDDDESPSATPPDTPIQTPVYGSPYRESAEEKKEEEDEEDEKPDTANEQSGGEESGEASSDDEEVQRKDLTSVLKKRTRSGSEEGESKAVKKPKAETGNESGEQTGEEEEGEVAKEETIVTTHPMDTVPDSQDDDPMTGDADKAENASNEETTTTKAAMQEESSSSKDQPETTTKEA